MLYLLYKNRSSLKHIILILSLSFTTQSYASEDDTSRQRSSDETKKETILVASNTEPEKGKKDNTQSKKPTDNHDLENENKEQVERAPNLDLKDIVEEPLTPTSTKSITDTDSDNENKASSTEKKAKQKNKKTTTKKTVKDKKENTPATDALDTNTEKKDNSIATEPKLELKNTEEQANNTDEASPKSEDNTSEALVILGAEVTPATSTRLAWSPAADITGLAVPTPVLVINGAHKGPTLCLTAAVHGDELNGIEIIRRVMYNIEPKKLHGKLIGIPIVNVLGFQRGSRYLPDRRDLNRFFPGDPKGSLASRIAYSLFNEVISHCDLLIDMHTGSMRRTNLPQIRANMSQPKVAEMVQSFDKTLVVHSPGNSGMLRNASNSVGITSVTLEVGESLRIQEEQIKSGTYSVNSFMDRNGMYPRRFNWGKAQPAYYQSVWVRAQTGGILFSDSKLGDYVKPGQKLGKVTDPITNKVAHIESTVNGRIIGMAVDQVVMPGFAAYHIGIRATEDELIEKVIDEPEVPLPTDEINPEE